MAWNRKKVDEDLFSRESLDPLTEGGIIDTVPESATDLSRSDLSKTDRAKLREFLQRAEEIASSNQDSKIEKAAEIIVDWLKKGHHPIVFCRFVATAKYVAEQLQQRIKDKYPAFRATAVSGETGGDEEREAAIAVLVETERRVLIATDCLSEGVNLQDHFDAVLHYDLPWNPNRLEQREGRVDRFGQPKSEVRAVVLFSEDNPIDGVVLDVLIRKARQIYQDLGISVPVPSDSESVVKAVVKAVFEGWRGQDAQQLRLDLPEVNTVKAFHENWQRNADREERSRSRFAQHTIDPDEVAREIESTDSVLGDPEAVRHFMLNAAQRLKFSLQKHDQYYVLDPAGLPQEIRERLGWTKPVKVVFVSPPPQDVENVIVLGRNHPLVGFLSERIVGRAFLPKSEQDFARAGAAYTNSVKIRTVLALLRVRYVLSRKGRQELFGEEVVTVAYEAVGGKISWKPTNDTSVLGLLENVTQAGNITPQEKDDRISRAIEELRNDKGSLRSIAEVRAADLEATYSRLKKTLGDVRVKVTAYEPDLLGDPSLLPGGNAHRVMWRSRSEGGLIPYDLLDKIASEDAAGQKPGDFGLPKGRRLTDEVSRVWADAQSLWSNFKRRRESLGDRDPYGTSITRSWIGSLLGDVDMLGFDLKLQASAVVVNNSTYAISHRSGEGEDAIPVHIEGLKIDLDRRLHTKLRTSPQAMVQDFLNNGEQVLWGIVTNGLGLRILRDSSRTARPTYLEFKRGKNIRVDGDDKKVAASFKKRNKQERASKQRGFSFEPDVHFDEYATAKRALTEISEDTAAAVRRKAELYGSWRAGMQHSHDEAVADLWTAQFFHPLTSSSDAAVCTSGPFLDFARDVAKQPQRVAAAQDLALHSGFRGILIPWLVGRFDVVQDSTFRIRFVPTPRYWVLRDEVESRLEGWPWAWLIGVKTLLRRPA